MSAVLDEVYNLVLRGKAKLVAGKVQEALDDGEAPMDVLNSMINAMGEVGERFKRNEVFVPEMLVAARAMKKGVEVLKPYLAGDNSATIGKMVMGTVQGDLHDIGKNLCVMMIESTGIEVNDLGVDVPAEKFIEAIQADPEVTIVGISALLTTTMPAMRATVAAIREAGLDSRVKMMVGGAPITQAFCDEIGADYYTEDAASCAETAKKIALGTI